MTGEAVIASQRVGAKRRPMTGSAKQSIAQQAERWIASSHPPSLEGGLRRTSVLLAMTVRHGFAISPRVSREVLVYFPPSPNKGRRECRAADAPDSRVCNGSG